MKSAKNLTTTKVIARKLFVASSILAIIGVNVDTAQATDAITPPPPPPFPLFNPPAPPAIPAPPPPPMASTSSTDINDQGKKSLAQIFDALFLDYKKPTEGTTISARPQSSTARLFAEIKKGRALKKIIPSSQPQKKKLSRSEEILNIGQKLGKTKTTKRPEPVISAAILAKRARELSTNPTLLRDDQLKTLKHSKPGETIGTQLMKALGVKNTDAVERTILDAFKKVNQLKEAAKKEVGEDWSIVDLPIKDRGVFSVVKTIKESISRSERFLIQEEARLRKSHIDEQNHDPQISAQRAKARQLRKKHNIDQAKEESKNLIELAKRIKIRDYNKYHAKLVKAGKAVYAAKERSLPAATTISVKELEELVVRGIYPKAQDLFKSRGKMPTKIKEFRKRKTEQLEKFFAESMNKDDLKILGERIKLVDKDNKLRLISDAISSQTRESRVIRPNGARNALLEAIRSGKTLRKTTTTKNTKPEEATSTIIKNPIEDLFDRNDSDAIRSVTLKEAQNNSPLIYLQLKREGEKALFLIEQNKRRAKFKKTGERDKSPYPTNTIKIDQRKFDLLIANDILPTPEDLYAKAPNEKIAIILKNAERIKVTKFKESLARLSIKNPESIEGIIALIEKENKDLFREINTPLSAEDIELLSRVEAVIEELPMEEVQKRKKARTELALESKQKLSKAKKSRMAGGAYTPKVNSDSVLKSTSRNKNVTNSLKKKESHPNKEKNADVAEVVEEKNTDAVEDVKEKNADAVEVVEENNTNAIEGVEGNQKNSIQKTSSVSEFKTPTTTIGKKLSKNYTHTERKKKVLTNALHDIRSNYSNLLEVLNSTREAEINFSKELGMTNNEVIQNAGNDSFISKISPEKAATLFLASASTLKSKHIEESIQHLKLLAAFPTQMINSFNSAILSKRLVVGVAAGDEDEDKPSVLRGVWSSITYGSSNQEALKNSSGYTGTTTGATIGFDFAPNEDSIFGLAYSMMNTNFNFKNIQAGNISSANSNIFSIYGKTALTRNLEINTQLSFNQTKVESSSKRLISADNYKNAKGSFASSGINAEAAMVYNLYNKSNITILPSLGLKYSNQHDGSYSESGSGVQNLSISSKKSQNLAAIASGMVQYSKRLRNGLELTPSLNLSIEKALSFKRKTIKTKLTWSDKEFDQVIDIPKPTKYAYNIGADFLVSRDNIELLTSYTHHIKKKYSSHQGTLKLKILF